MKLVRLLSFTFAALLMWSSVADASQSREPVRLRYVGVVAISLGEESEEATAFRTGLHDAGYIEGHDIASIWWYGHGSYDHVSQAVADLVQRKVNAAQTFKPIGGSVPKGFYRNPLTFRRRFTALKKWLRL